jgi:hypothetical protein
VLSGYRALLSNVDEPRDFSRSNICSCCSRTMASSRLTIGCSTRRRTRCQCSAGRNGKWNDLGSRATSELLTENCRSMRAALFHGACWSNVASRWGDRTVSRLKEDIWTGVFWSQTSIFHHIFYLGFDYFLGSVLVFGCTVTSYSWSHRVLCRRTVGWNNRHLPANICCTLYR